MHFFKLFLSATFAIVATARALVALLGDAAIDAMPSLAGALSGVSASIGLGVLSFVGGALLAQIIRKRSVPKATRG